MDTAEKQKQVYYVISALEEGSGRFDKTSVTLVFDFFINNKNAYASLQDISDSLKKNSIWISPESLFSALSSVSYNYIFDCFPAEENIRSPFRMNVKVFDDLIHTSDSINDLNSIVHQYVLDHKFQQSIEPLIIDVLLETVFSCNIKFLKSIVSKKDELRLGELIISGNKPGNYDDIVYSAYNGLLLQSDSAFDEVLRLLILRMFDFLALYYNPEYEKSLKQKFGNKCFYLDSSFIVRLLGFDGRFRTERSLELLSILKGVNGIQFVVHSKTVEEAQKKIKEIIDKSINILSKDIKTIESISRKTGKQDPIYELFISLKRDGKVIKYTDFRLYFSNITALLSQLMPNLTIDSHSLYSATHERASMFEDLQKADKTIGRIKHIIKLLDYIDKLRGSNNYNPLEIKYWLLTTDKKTLDIDSQFIDSISDSGKSICIMPSEIIRQIDHCSGNIKGDHLNVFKKYMMKTKVYAQQYTEDEIETISKIATLVEQTNLEEYDVDRMIDNLFSEYTLDEIQTRLKTLSSQREKDQELVDLFNKTNANYIDTKYSRIVDLEERKAERWGHLWFSLIIYIIPAVLIISLIVQLIDFHNISWNPSTWFKQDLWSKIEPAFTIIDLVVLAIAVIIDKIFRARFVNCYSQWRIKRLTEKADNGI